MRLAAVFGLALGAAMGVAQANPPAPPVMMAGHHAGMGMDFDSNHDGWLSRAEASAAADQMFDHMDSNHDGRLTSADRPPMGDEIEMHHGGAHELPGADDENCTRRVEGSGDGQRITVICERGAGHSDGHGERHVIVRRGDHEAPQAGNSDEPHGERNVTVIVQNDGEAAAAPTPPRPPHPPMFMMLLGNSEEADRDGDGALSREEFRAQQLRFFDASDANGDGRIRFEHPPMPPMPPQPPAPPAPPHR